MEERGLASSDLVIPVAVIGRKEMMELMESADVVLSA